MAFLARPAPDPAAGGRRSASGGVEVIVRGWRPGLSKVRLTQTFREGGVGLSQATRLTGRVLEGQAVRVRLGQFRSLSAARRALAEIGIEEIESAAAR